MKVKIPSLQANRFYIERAVSNQVVTIPWIPSPDNNVTSESVYDYIEYANSWPIGLPDILDSNLGPSHRPSSQQSLVCALSSSLRRKNMLKVKHDVSHFRVPAVEMCNELFKKYIKIWNVWFGNWAREALYFLNVIFTSCKRIFF